ncbi:dienelactone hydrolase family protein [Chthonobacter rhizosphaerae]|uniref:dienelactone hydrolase family protein n=1 Tax=Chthonobacter rhizosphaerae TaxID=2735553 RepID=UPI0015EEEC5C|nr:dienelactone hydrolase family protein [Chthonobacter rhizosphaerae]
MIPALARHGARLILAALVLGPGPAAALDEEIEVPTRTLTDAAFLAGDAAGGDPVTITGRLTGPDGPGRQPVVILLHGTDGPRSGAAGSWRAYLDSLGIATLRLDSYTARGLREVSRDQQAFPQFAQVYDAYRAADVLAGHPAVDGSRIVLMGFSRGGNAALYGAMRRFHEGHGPRRARIVAYLPFYPACNIDLERGDEMVDAPIRQFHGEADDWTPVQPCRDLFARLEAAGADAELTVYPGALHGFDNPGNPALFVDPDARTSAGCRRREVGGALVNVDTGRPFTYADACVTTGPSSRYQDAAATAAKSAVKAVLSAVFANP